MECEDTSLGPLLRVQFPTEERMLREDVVREMLARLERREGITRIARELGVRSQDGEGLRARGGRRAVHVACVRFLV